MKKRVYLEFIELGSFLMSLDITRILTENLMFVDFLFFVVSHGWLLHIYIYIYELKFRL